MPRLSFLVAERGFFMFHTRTLARLGLLCLALGAFGLAAAQQTLRVLTHDSFAVPDEVAAAFSEQTGIELEIIQAGDAGEMVNRAILTKERPLADVLYGIDNNLLGPALEAGIFEPYQSPALASVEARYRFDPEHFVTPVDVGFVNFNLDLAYFEAAGLEPPQEITELTEPRYRGLTVVPDPATSSPGLAFMLATIAKFGEEGWLEYWAALRDNDLLVTSGWSDAYYNAFSRYGGDRPVVLSYASSPAAEVIFAEQPLEAAPTANLFCARCAYEQIEAAGILKGTDKPDAARAFIDFLLSPDFQAAIPESMFVYPVVEGTPLPETFDAYAQAPAPEARASLPSQAVADSLQGWLADWRAVVQQGRDPADLR